MLRSNCDVLQQQLKQGCIMIELMSAGIRQVARTAARDLLVVPASFAANVRLRSDHLVANRKSGSGTLSFTRAKTADGRAAALPPASGRNPPALRRRATA